MSAKDFKVGDQLGEGSFGAVSLCTQISTGKVFAIKTIVIAQVERQRHGLQQVMTEKKALIKLADPTPHPSILQLHFAFRDSDHLYLVLDYCAGGELFGQIKRLGSCHVSCARWLTAELVNALEYMHAKRILHRDLKPENILLDDAGHIKLIDFGSARLLDSSDDYESFVGTAEYVAPEVLADEDATEASDFWALGCILFQMLSGSPPFQGESQYLTFERIKALDFTKPEAFDEMIPAAREMVMGLLHPKPEARLGGAGTSGAGSALRAHPFFTAAEPPIDFDTILTVPPPPLVPPPPMPSIDGDLVLNSQLVGHGALGLEDRKTLAERQAGVRWAVFMQPDEHELLVLATTVVKRRGTRSAWSQPLPRPDLSIGAAAHLPFLSVALLTLTPPPSCLPCPLSPNPVRVPPPQASTRRGGGSSS